MNEKPLLNIYDHRLDSVKEILNKLRDLLLKDELIKTLKNDGISKEFISMRIQEIIENFINNDRELLLKQIHKKYSKLKENFQEKLSELSKEKAKNREYEEMHFKNEKNISRLERKLVDFKENEGKMKLLEKENKNFREKIDEMIEEKTSIEEKYKNYTLEIEKSFLEEKEQKTEEYDNYQAKLRYYKTSIEELVTKLDEYEAKNVELNDKIKEISHENEYLSSENNSNKAKAYLYKKISNQIKVSLISKIKEICFEFKKDSGLLGKWLNDCFFQMFSFLNEAIKDILKKVNISKMKYKGIKENLEEKISKLQENLAIILGKFESVKGNFTNEYEDKIKEIQKLKENSWDYEKKYDNFINEIEFLRKTCEDKERELDRQCHEKKKLMNEAYQNEINYKKLYSDYEKEIEKNRSLLKEITNLNELMTKKNVNENIKAELYKKMQKITKKF